MPFAYYQRLSARERSDLPPERCRHISVAVLAPAELTPLVADLRGALESEQRASVEFGVRVLALGLAISSSGWVAA